MGAIHSTATLSSEGTCGLYGLRLVHRPNIFLSCFGPRAGQAVFFWPQSAANPNPILSPNKAHYRVNLCKVAYLEYFRVKTVSYCGVRVSYYCLTMSFLQPNTCIIEESLYSATASSCALCCIQSTHIPGTLLTKVLCTIA